MASERSLRVLIPLLCFILDVHTGSLNYQIIGGHEAVPHSKPWMAYISYTNHGMTYICGGFLVRKDFVMTAAHCGGSNIKVSLGLHAVKEKNDKNTFSVLNIYRHPNYNSETHENDIMLLQMNDEILLNENIKVIALHKKNKKVPVGTECNVAGWGKTNRYLNVSSQVLMEVNVTIVRNKECQNILDMPIDSSMICAGQSGTKGDAAQGDSGSPLVCEGVATGIVSFGNEKPPGVYTLISSFLPWIRKIMSFSKPTMKDKTYRPLTS
ncbi:mast cell protease 1A-like [Pelobates cultripes]|uniref:Mast cell protease 1A-like n=1 Tax=Pelobates cultripes TaxID=61616 RepID=A0AAD1S517_PELCU|nr:mast cell protease 1A-like [Pelobates cultripes]